MPLFSTSVTTCVVTFSAFRRRGCCDNLSCHLCPPPHDNLACHARKSHLPNLQKLHRRAKKTARDTSPLAFDNRFELEIVRRV